MLLIIATALIGLFTLACFGVAAHAAWRLRRIYKNTHTDFHSYGKEKPHAQSY